MANTTTETNDKIAAYRGQYTDLIVEACAPGCSLLDACEIEQIMRTHLAQSHHIYGLDGYTKTELTRMARESQQALEQIRADDPEFTLLF